MAKIAVIIRPDLNLEPSLDSDYEIVKKMGYGEMLQLVYTQIRSPKNHRRYFAMHQIAYENRDAKDLAQDARSFRKMIEMTAGLRTEVRTFSGQTIYLPKSIAWDSMDEVEFQEMKKSCGDVINERMGLDKETLQEEVLKLAYINSP